MLNLIRKPSRLDVVAFYEVLLGREPENEAVIEQYRAMGSCGSIVRAIGATPEYAKRAAKSPFFYYHSCFDAEGVMRAHAVAGLKPKPGYLVNFLGVVIDPKFLPNILSDKAGQVEDIPIPANWHADIAEWAAALRAVDLAKDVFTVAELGCGWGCWISNTALAAKRRKLKVHAIGVEGDNGHIAFAREACLLNGLAEHEHSLHRGIAAASDGIALFPRQQKSGVNWGLEPVFGATAEQRQRAIAKGTHDELPMISLSRLFGGRRIDLLHIDIQGGESDLIAQSAPFLSEQVAYMVVGTHSREIEGRIMDTLLGRGWRLEIERPAILTLKGERPNVVVDGVQGWRNMTLLPE